MMFSCENVQGSTLDAFQRGMAPPTKIYDVVFRSLGEGLDTRGRPIVLAISRRTCDEQITSKCFFAGYVSGSSLGFAQTLAMYIVTKLEKDWSAARAPWLRSISEIRVTWTVAKDAVDRVFKSLGTLIPLRGE